MYAGFAPRMVSLNMYGIRPRILRFWVQALSEIPEEERAKLRQDHLKVRYLELKVCSLEGADFELKVFLRCFVRSCVSPYEPF